MLSHPTDYELGIVAIIATAAVVIAWMFRGKERLRLRVWRIVEVDAIERRKPKPKKKPGGES